MPATQPTDCLDIVRCLALFLRDQRDPTEIVHAAANSMADRLPRSVVRVWLSRSTKGCESCPAPDACERAFHCLQLEASAGADVSCSSALERVAYGISLPGIVGKNEEEFLCTDLRGFGDDNERLWAKDLGLTAFCGFPIKSAGRLLGVLGIYLEILPSKEACRNLSTVSMILSQALGSSLLRCEQFRMASELEEKVEHKTSELRERVADLEETRRAMLNMMSEAFEAQRQMRMLTEKLEIMVADRTEELVVAKEEAERANELKSKFLGRVSHELRTPMHGITSFAKLGLRKVQTIDRDKLVVYFQQILESAGELLPMIDDLLDISRIEAGKINYHFAAEDLRSLVFDIAGKYEPMFAERRLELEVSVSDDFPRRVRCDRKHLRHAWVNLLGNAAKFSAAGTKVSIVLALVEEGVTLSVQDRGPGIPEDELDHIFDSFTQSSTTRDEYEGAGLGLSITQAIIDSHQGSITARNRESGGTEFLITLPWNGDTIHEEQRETSIHRIPDISPQPSEPENAS